MAADPRGMSETQLAQYTQEYIAQQAAQRAADQLAYDAYQHDAQSVVNQQQWSLAHGGIVNSGSTTQYGSVSPLTLAQQEQRIAIAAYGSNPLPPDQSYSGNYASPVNAQVSLTPAAQQYLQANPIVQQQAPVGTISPSSGMAWSGTGWTNPSNIPAQNFASANIIGINPSLSAISQYQRENYSVPLVAQQQQQQRGGAAVDIVNEIYKSGGIPDPTLLAKARQQSGLPVDTRIDMYSGRNTVAPYNPTPGGEMITDAFGRTTFQSYSGGNSPLIGGKDMYVPIYGDLSQQLRSNSKIEFNEFGAYNINQVVPSTQEGFTRVYPIVVAGGGTGALQGGMVSGKPLTKLLYDAYGNSMYDVNDTAIQDMLNNPQNYSRLGSEAYGGMVLPLDGRTLQGEFSKGNTILPGRFAQDTENFSNLVNFNAVNTPKQAMGNSELPLYAPQSFATQPVFQQINTTTGKFEAVYPDFSPVKTNVVPQEQPEFILTRPEPVATVYRQAPEPSRLESQKYQYQYGGSLINNPAWNATQEVAENAAYNKNADELFADRARAPEFQTQVWMEPQPYQLTKNPLYGLPQPFVSVGKEEGSVAKPIVQAPAVFDLRAGSIGQPIGNVGVVGIPGTYSSTQETVKSEPSLGNIVLNVAGSLGNIIPGFVGQAPFKTDYGFGETKITTKYQVDTGIRTRSELPVVGGPEYTGVFIGSDNKSTSTLTEKTGTPYFKGGVEYQDYKTTDLSKVSGIYTIEKTETVKEKSVADNWNAALSSYIPPVSVESKPSAYKSESLFGLTSSEKSPAASAYNYGSAFAYGFYDDFQRKPLTAAQNAAFAVGLSLATEGIGTFFTSAAQGTRAAPIVAGVGKYTPVAMGALYTWSVAARSTDMFTDYSPNAAQRLGGIVSTEAIPFVVGGYAYSRAGYGPTEIRSDISSVGEWYGSPARNRAGMFGNDHGMLAPPKPPIKTIDLRETIDLTKEIPIEPAKANIKSTFPREIDLSSYTSYKEYVPQEPYTPRTVSEPYSPFIEGAKKIRTGVSGGKFTSSSGMEPLSYEPTQNVKTIDLTKLSQRTLDTMDLKPKNLGGRQLTSGERMRIQSRGDVVQSFAQSRLTARANLEALRAEQTNRIKEVSSSSMRSAYTTVFESQYPEQAINSMMLVSSTPSAAARHLMLTDEHMGPTQTPFEQPPVSVSQKTIRSVAQPQVIQPISNQKSTYSSFVATQPTESQFPFETTTPPYQPSIPTPLPRITTPPVIGGGDFFEPPSPPRKQQWIDIPGVPPLPSSGGGGPSSPFTRKRKGAFMETFNVGLDYSIRTRSTKQAKSFTSPKPKSKAKRGKK